MSTVCPNRLGHLGKAGYLHAGLAYNAAAGGLWEIHHPLELDGIPVGGTTPDPACKARGRAAPPMWTGCVIQRLEGFLHFDVPSKTQSAHGRA
eukprot:5009570-Amphidinium_carterae.1